VSTPDERTATLVRRFYDELWNEWRLDLADELLAEAVRFRGSLGFEGEGRGAFKGYVETVRAAFPDWHNRVEDLLVDGDRAVTRMTWRGTHLGPLGRLEPTGVQVEYPGAAFFHVVQGSIREAWVVGDTWPMWRALGRGL
jgi:predicted ester cyclase